VTSHSVKSLRSSYTGLYPQKRSMFLEASQRASAEKQGLLRQAALRLTVCCRPLLDGSEVADMLAAAAHEAHPHPPHLLHLSYASGFRAVFGIV